MDIERKCEFNRITPEEIIIYKFAATMNDTKAQDNFIKGPLEIQLVLETIELDNYNCKYSEKKTNTEIKDKHHRTVPRTENKLPTQNQHGSKKRMKRTRENKTLEIVASAENPTGRRSSHAQHGRHNAITVQEQDTLPRYADQEP